MTDLEHQHRLDVQLGRIAVALERIANALEGMEGEGMSFDDFMQRPNPRVDYVDIPVVDGVATLPDGTKVPSSSNVVRMPVLASDNE
jgi:hypothetical protein